MRRSVHLGDSVCFRVDSSASARIGLRAARAMARWTGRSLRYAPVVSNSARRSLPALAQMGNVLGVPLRSRELREVRLDSESHLEDLGGKHLYAPVRDTGRGGGHDRASTLMGLDHSGQFQCGEGLTQSRSTHP